MRIPPSTFSVRALIPAVMQPAQRPSASGRGAINFAFPVAFSYPTQSLPAEQGLSKPFALRSFACTVLAATILVY